MQTFFVDFLIFFLTPEKQYLETSLELLRSAYSDISCHSNKGQNLLKLLGTASAMLTVTINSVIARERSDRSNPLKPPWDRHGTLCLAMTINSLFSFSFFNFITL